MLNIPMPKGDVILSCTNQLNIFDSSQMLEVVLSPRINFGISYRTRILFFALLDLVPISR